jgi:hypothetical protein
MEERVAYSVDPPRRITVEMSNAYLQFGLKGPTFMRLTVPFPISGYQLAVGFDYVPAASHGTYPGATYYQVRPSKDAMMAWENFALHIDVPTLAFGTPPGLGVYIIPAAQFGRHPVPSDKFTIIPAPTVELGPAGMMGPTNLPHLAEITFPTLSVEWIEWSQTARYRAGNVVLDSNVYWRWDDTNPNAIYIGRFHIDLVSGVVSECFDPTSGICGPSTTLFQVIIDDGDPSSVYFEPDLWW